VEAAAGNERGVR